MLRVELLDVWLEIAHGGHGHAQALAGVQQVVVESADFLGVAQAVR
jgi:hypothetical protein